MKCSKCNSENCAVISDQLINNGAARRRKYKCLNCMEKFSTVEKYAESEMLNDEQKIKHDSESIPEKIIRFDTVRVEYGYKKLCSCKDPHYEIDYQNRLVRCNDCGAIVDPLEALMQIAKDTKKWSEYIETLNEQRKQILGYHPRRIVIKELEKRYIRADKAELEPTCPHCGESFDLSELVNGRWVRKNNFTEG